MRVKDLNLSLSFSVLQSICCPRYTCVHTHMHSLINKLRSLLLYSLMYNNVSEDARAHTHVILSQHPTPGIRFVGYLVYWKLDLHPLHVESLFVLGINRQHERLTDRFDPGYLRAQHTQHTHNTQSTAEESWIFSKSSAVTHAVTLRDACTRNQLHHRIQGTKALNRCFKVGLTTTLAHQHVCRGTCNQVSELSALSLILILWHWRYMALER